MKTKTSVLLTSLIALVSIFLSYAFFPSNAEAEEERRSRYYISVLEYDSETDDDILPIAPDDTLTLEFPRTFDNNQSAYAALVIDAGAGQAYSADFQETAFSSGDKGWDLVANVTGTESSTLEVSADQIYGSRFRVMIANTAGPDSIDFKLAIVFRNLDQDFSGFKSRYNMTTFAFNEDESDVLAPVDTVIYDIDRDLSFINSALVQVDADQDGLTSTYTLELQQNAFPSGDDGWMKIDDVQGLDESVGSIAVDAIQGVRSRLILHTTTGTDSTYYSLSGVFRKVDQ